MSASPVQEKDFATDSLFHRYSPAAGGYDELQGAPGVVRSHWRDFKQSLERLGRHELSSRWENGRRIIREHGVTYNVYGDPEGMDRPWALDLVPLLIPGDDWAKVERGLIQRSRLFNLILADIYSGGQLLVRHGFIPPELIYANPAFLRPCRGIAPAKGVFVHLHACDLARSPDGHWWVLGDRAQAPSGPGYALENRTVISRILPDEIRSNQVRRLSTFFRTEREMLFQLAPKQKENPNIVLLTPGPHNETYFEHAYLARYLGFPLVEGADLTVRERRVFLKTLEGLEPVDVILRRVDDSFCDPLELRSDSFLGVSGLVEATRAGNVTLANALGAGLMESPVFLAFLPAVCRQVLGEELLLPSVATWWCGQGTELRYVLDHLDELVVKPAFGRPNSQRWFGGTISAAERRKLIEAIHARPRDFVGQERVVLSRAPVWLDGRFEARAVVVRTYVASSGDSLAVLPGGLTRVSATAEDPVVSMQRGSGSKDTWVLSDPTTTATEVAQPTVELRVAERVQAGVPSRAADQLFWLGRYTERLEQRLRVLRCAVAHISEGAFSENPAELTALATMMSNLDLVPAPDVSFNAVKLQRQILDLIYKPDLTGSVRELLGRIRLNASTVRDRFSGDTWRILGRLDADARARPGRLPLASATALIHNLVLDLAAFNGMEMENMTRGRGWRFLDFGRRLERGLSVVGLVRAAVNTSAVSASVLELLLEIADSIMTYRRLYFAEPRLAGVLQLLLADESNPRSLAFQIKMLRDHALALVVDSKTADPRDEQQHIAMLSEMLKAADFNDVAAWHAQKDVAPLLDWLANCMAAFSLLSEQLTNHYFSHTLPRIS
jgi:uncharacterized circularly permuted ATP-grasp superfamily protein/uncharacterized alpha-E superfamily protein